MGGQSPVGGQPAPVGTGTHISQATAPQDESRRGSASLRIREILHIAATAHGRMGRAGRSPVISGRIATGVPAGVRHPISGRACREPLRDRSLGVAVLDLVAHRAKPTGGAALKQAGGNITQGSGREKGRFRRTGEMHKLQALWAQFTNLYKKAARWVVPRLTIRQPTLEGILERRMSRAVGAWVKA
jgi:hypothetical protein